jgi:radical SAM superfamily enzyme
LFTNKNFGREGREENIKNANAVATYLNKKRRDGEWKAIYVDAINGWKSHPINKKTHVVMSLVNPYNHLRKELRNNNRNEVTEVYLFSNRVLRREYHVKNFEKGDADCVLNTDQEVEESWEQLQSLLNL